MENAHDGWRRRYYNSLMKRKNYQMLGSVAKAENLIGHCESEAEEEDDDEDDDALKIDTEDSLHLDLLGLGNDEDYGPTSPFCKR